MSNDAAGIGMSFSFGPGEKKGDAAARRPDPPQASFQAAGAVEVPAQPLRLLVLANLRGLPEQRDLAPRRVRLATLDEDLAALAPTLRLDVKDHLTGGPRPLEVVATLRARRDLEPDRLAGACDALAPLLALHDDLDALASDPAAAERVEARRAAYDGLAGLAPALAALDRALRGLRGGGAPSRAGGGALDSVLAAGAKAASGDAVLDSIFAMVDAGPATPAPAPSPTTTTTTTTGGGGSWRADLDEARAQASGLLERQLGEVLRHPQTRQVEAAWRSLELLLARCPRDGRVEVEALDCDPDAPEAALIHGVVRRHAAPDAPPAPSLVVMDATFGRSAADLARLELIAEAAEALQAPVVVGLGDAFLGTDLPALAALDHPAGALERGLEKWNGLRAGPSFRWLVAATNRVLLRAPWSRGQRGARRAGEQVAMREDLCWGNPAYLVAAAAAASVDRTGWPADLTDPAGLADLVMDPAAPPERRGPLEAPLALDAVEALNDLGVLAPTGPRDRDVARITRAPTAHRAPADEPRFASSLPYQLAASRIAAALLRARDVLARAGDPEAVRERIERFAAGLVGDTGPGAGAQASLVRGQDGPEVEVEVRTGRAVLGGVSVTLGLAL